MTRGWKMLHDTSVARINYNRVVKAPPRPVGPITYISSHRSQQPKNLIDVEFLLDLHANKQRSLVKTTMNFQFPKKHRGEFAD